jgi:hypothetical protein
MSSDDQLLEAVRREQLSVELRRLFTVERDDGPARFAGSSRGG